MVSLCRDGSAQVLPPAVGLEVWLIDEPAPESNANLDFVLEDTAEAIAAWRDKGERVFYTASGPKAELPSLRLPTCLGAWGSTAGRR